MAYNATVFPVMIASPGDVHEERNIVRDIIHEWNDLHSSSSSFVLLPVGWDTHSTPDLGGRPQELINEQVLKQCDLLVGVFWTRIGTPTGEAESGTVEEIQNHVQSGKPAMIYFSTAPIAPQSIDNEQFARLTKFKNWCKTQGIIEEYDNLSSFSDKFRRHIHIVVRDNKYLRSKGGSQDTDGEQLLSLHREQSAENHDASFGLSEEARQLLIEASKDKGGLIISLRHMGGQSIQTNGINFTDSGDRRSVARWEAAVEQLLDNDLIVARGDKNQVFELTNKGYELADSLQSDSA